MATRYLVTSTDRETGGVVIEGPFAIERAALSFAESWAKAFYGDEDVTWYESAGPGEYHVGRILEDGSRTDPLIRISVEEGPAIENAPESPTRTGT